MSGSEQEVFRAPGDAVAQDWPRVARYLAAQGLDMDKDAPPRQFRGGLANLNYCLRIDGEDVVLRRPPPGPLPPGAYDMARESRILSRLWRQFPLAPRVLHLCEDTSVLGAPFQLIEYRPGVSVGVSVPSQVADAEGFGRDTGRVLIDVLVALHRVDPEEVGLDTLGRPDGFLQRAASGWTHRARLAIQDWAPPATIGMLDGLAAWLEGNRAPERNVVLLHNDFKLDNLLLDRQALSAGDVRPVALLDWDQGTRGDALFDLATLLAYWSQADDAPGARAMRQMPTAGPGFPGREQVAQAYARASGRDLSDFRFHRVLAQVKVATIFLQLYLRYHRGETCDPRYAEFGEVGQALLLQAHDIAANRMF